MNKLEKINENLFAASISSPSLLIISYPSLEIIKYINVSHTVWAILKFNSKMILYGSVCEDKVL
jgi:hypothetical protein